MFLKAMNFCRKCSTRRIEKSECEGGNSISPTKAALNIIVLNNLAAQKIVELILLIVFSIEIPASPFSLRSNHTRMLIFQFPYYSMPCPFVHLHGSRQHFTCSDSSQSKDLNEKTASADGWGSGGRSITTHKKLSAAERFRHA